MVESLSACWTIEPVPDAGIGRPEGSCALREAEQLLASLPTILIGLSQDLRITRWNLMAGKVFAQPAEEVCGKPIDAVKILWDWDRVRLGLERCRSDGISVRLDELSFVRANGKDGVLGLTINPLLRDGGVFLGFTIIGADITERKMLEKQLTQAQKLRSIGQLASGIAHEINTPTQYVGDNIRFLKDAFEDIICVLRGDEELLAAARGGCVSPELIRRLQEGRERADLDYLVSEVPVAIQHTLEGVERISKIVRAMKDFAHPGREEKASADLNQIIDTTLTVARNEWKNVH
jgi:PAS domain S-box-containing protein